MKFLFDASSMLEAIRSFEEEKVLRVFRENCILDLTKYEVGNALWKEYILHNAIREEEFREFLDFFRSVLRLTKVVAVGAESLLDVAETAAKEQITFYDASYIAIARIQKLILITEDRQLAKLALKYAKTAQIKDILS